MLNFAHSGGVGDILYGCYLIKKICQENNFKSKIFLKRTNSFNYVVDAYETLKRLLVNQEYIEDVIVIDNIQGFSNWEFNFEFYDLDKFRNFADNRSNLIDCHLKSINRNDLIRSWLNESWINVNSNFNLNEPYIVINRTPRYRARNGKNMWINSLEKYKNHKKYFVGLNDEFNDFNSEFNIEIEHYKTNDLYDISFIIKNAQITLCNPSSVLALCVSMNLPYLIELDDQWDSVVKINRNNEIIMN